MSKIAIVYWSATGNTETMALSIAEGVTAAGGEAVLLSPGHFDADCWDQYDAVAFGCPAMGSEVLEECEFEPMYAALEPTLSGKKILLFGSYGWGDGEWMRTWCERSADADLLAPEGLTVNYEPDNAAKQLCREYGEKLANW